eukprot:6115622-Pyramimonas_sp.AAC.1
MAAEVPGEPRGHLRMNVLIYWCKSYCFIVRPPLDPLWTPFGPPPLACDAASRLLLFFIHAVLVFQNCSGCVRLPSTALSFRGNLSGVIYGRKGF